jgi:hypothetical protein
VHGEYAHLRASSVASQEKHPALLQGRHAMVGACVLVSLQAGMLWIARGQSGTALLSDVVQLLLGLLCVLESMRAWRRSTDAWGYYWLWLAVTFSIWTAAQILK